MIFLFLCCCGIINPNTGALSLAPFSKNTGTASSLLGAFQMAIGALASVGVSMFQSKSAMPMSLLMFVAAAIAFLILIIGRRNISNKVEGTVVAVGH
jgi:DHA1 family bicyclomycin/chloramphenicol resistance-like MFS transporter